jgi:hypothetical protein
MTIESQTAGAGCAPTVRAFEIVSAAAAIPAPAGRRRASHQPARNLA